MPRTSAAIKGVLVLALVGGLAWAGLHYKERALLAFKNLRASRVAQVNAPPDSLRLVDDALKRAQVKDRVAVIRFNLQDCGVCERMSREVFTQGEWGKFSADRLEVTDYLMPTSFTSDQPELVHRIQLLEAFAKASGAAQGFPFVAVLGRDGSLLGARSGYLGGGAAPYIRWIEQLARGDQSQAKKFPASTKTEQPVAPAAAAVAPSPATNAIQPGASAAAMNTPPVLELVIKGVSGTGDRKIALIGAGGRNFPLMAGEQKRVSWTGGTLTIECRSIGDGEVMVQVEGESAPRRLSLPAN